MMKIILFLSLLSFLQIHRVYGTEELLSVVAVFRHGEIVPTYYAPNDQYKDPKKWETEPGELTKFGTNEHAVLGKWLRDRYNNFIPQIYNEGDVYVRSANINRCVKSAEANLAALFPTSHSSISIHTVPAQNDTLLEMEKVCPKYQKPFQDFMTRENNRMSPLYKELLDFLSENLGENMTSVYNMSAPYETMVVEEKYKMKQPAWTTKEIDGLQVYPTTMKSYSDSAYIQPTVLDELARLATGRFFDTICSHFEAVATEKKENKIANKMVMYFGYKQTLCNIINTLMADYDQASYASTLLFELWRNNTDSTLYMKPYYVIDQKVSDLRVYACIKNKCTLDNFLKAIDPMRMDQKAFDKDCLGKSGSAMLSGSIFASLMVSLTLIYNVL